MRVHVAVCQQWLWGEHTVEVVGVYRSEDFARTASREDSGVKREGVRFGYRVVEVEVASRWERAWRWLEGWVNPTWWVYPSRWDR